MTSILKEFYLGNLNTSPRLIKPNSRLSRAMEALVEAEEKLLANLDGELKKSLEDFSTTQMEINSLSCEENFIYGYRLGVLMTTEVFSGINDLTVGEQI